MMKQRTSPPPGWLAVLLLAAVVLCNGTAMGQSFQNPYWVMAGDPPELFKNTVPSSFPALPFISPSPGIGGITYPERVATAVNGVFDECGAPLFYVAGDWVFDEDGVSVGELKYKDGWSKVYWPLVPYEFNNPSPVPSMTQNFEAVICEVPAAPGEYFIFCSESRLSGSRIFVYQYDAVGKTLVSNNLSIPIALIGGNSPLSLPSTRFALSKYDAEAGRILYVLGSNGLVQIPIGPSVSNITDLVGESILYYGYKEPCPELELSHDGNTLTWATYNGSSSLLHFFDLTKNQHSTFEPASNAMHYLSGLEFLPDGRLAVAITWNGTPLQSLNGVGYFNLALSGFSHVNNSAPYQDGMIELGFVNSPSWSLYAISSQNLVRIAISASTTGSIASTTPFTVESYTGWGGLGISAYGLPDQVDGESYPYSSCGSGGTDPTESANPLVESTSTGSFSFTPIIIHYNP